MSNINTRDEIINTAQRLFYSVGYDKTSIQMIINEIDIAKGTFYHYFKSKSELMLEIVKITVEQIVEQLNAVVTNSSLSPIEKINTIFNASAKYKAANLDYIKAIMYAMYNDSNLILRENIKRLSLELSTPLLNTIIEEGMETGAFKCKYSNQGEIIWVIGMSLSDKMCFAIMNSNKDTADELFINKTIDDLNMYTYTIETILEMEHGKLNLFDEDFVRDFLQKLSS
ncbi:TetR/AcrR family transcriptional regulator [Oceanirhabdus sp. W0125-5]|uniref:TetR/AcrR family transcriptional regulator n=1 Tax=Oceanirhabdus sp. W0125-5 TaxID=2999116 RepID=UPI0022F2D754|nr:TetR/AcrR family transcriptional regulator [Oceanirhabdus sp. W0125-5]WBW98266.1 TetR/AcrR family transcriptional regulator [Oceanirhabdus sp. W0125-5]